MGSIRTAMEKIPPVGEMKMGIVGCRLEIVMMKRRGFIRERKSFVMVEMMTAISSSMRVTLSAQF